MLQRALFPLAPGKLTVTPMEAQVSQRRLLRARGAARGASSPSRSTIEAVALPREGQPAGFPPGNVGRFTLDAAVDRAAVAVGDAVTLTVTVRGIGNVRNVVLPALPALPGWKSYEPKTNVALDAAAVMHGQQDGSSGCCAPSSRARPPSRR